MKGIYAGIGLVSGLLFGAATPLSKALLSSMDSFQLAGLLYLGAAAAYIPFVLKNGRRQLQELRQGGRKIYLAGIIVCGGIAGPAFLMLGLKSAQAMSVSVWLNMELAATAVLGVLIFKDHLNRYAIAGVILTIAAGVIVSMQETGSGMSSGLFILAACIMWGVDNHLTALVDTVSPKTITFIKGLVGGSTNLIIGIAVSGADFHFASVLAAVAIGAVSYGISIVLYVLSAQNLGATRSQILFSTAPFWGLAGSAVFLHEPFGLITFIAAAVLCAGIAVTCFSSHIHSHRHAAMLHTHMHRHDDGHHIHPHAGGIADSEMHTHLHQHKAESHAHPHVPDMHHRHEH